MANKRTAALAIDLLENTLSIKWNVLITYFLEAIRSPYGTVQ